MTADGLEGLLGAGICKAGLCGGGGGALLWAWEDAATGNSNSANAIHVMKWGGLIGA